MVCSLPGESDFLGNANRNSNRNSNRNFNRNSNSGNQINRGYVDMSISDCNYPLIDYCENYNGDQIGSDKNSPKFQSSCSMITEYRNLTSKVFKGADSSQLICTAKNVKVNQCGGGCNSKIVVKSEDPYIEQICQCCTYELDPIEPVRFIDYECTGGFGGKSKNSIRNKRQTDSFHGGNQYPSDESFRRIFRRASRKQRVLASVMSSVVL